jgi:tetratricopeptide (TPR) repeat protein
MRTGRNGKGNLYHVTVPLDSTVAERMMSEIVGPLREGPPEEAQQLVYEAWDCEDPQRRVELARQALEVSERCSDAHLILAQDAAASCEEAVALYRRAVETARQAIGGLGLSDQVGDFRTLLQVAPYKRALLALAEYLWSAGRLEEAVESCREMLRFDPDDEQGIRYLLATCLLDLGWDDQVADLLDLYGSDKTTPWVYSAALLAFRRENDTETSRKLLGRAIRVNPLVPDFMLGRRKLPREFSSVLCYDDESEAVIYAVDFGSGWKRTPGAMDWLARRAR